jgi:hypothetical protein
MIASMRRVSAIVIAVALGLVPAAAAKGPVSVSACGAPGCSQASLSPPWNHLVIPPYFMRVSPDRPPRAAPWFGLRFHVPDNRWRVDDRCQTPRPRFAFCYPQRRVFALADGSYAGGRDLPGRRIVWVRLSPAEASVYARLTHGLEPLPADDLPGAAPAETDEGGQAKWPFVLGGALLVAGAVTLALSRARHRPGLQAANPRT